MGFPLGGSISHYDSEYELGEEFTKSKCDCIIKEIELGASTKAAVELVGIPYQRLYNFINATNPTKKSKDFKTRILMARAVARVNAEQRVNEEKPLDWLKHSPDTKQEWGQTKMELTGANGTPLMGNGPEVSIDWGKLSIDEQRNLRELLAKSLATAQLGGDSEGDPES
jgi:hypothetical protein